MSKDEERKEPEYKTITDKDLVKFMSYLFVIVVFGYIFLKILFID